ncbi:MAG: TnpV protein [Clostridia bacterium]|nr:TnpV protein [Clostridia bacterium]
MVRQTADAEGINEELTTRYQLMWVECMNNIQLHAEEILIHELIYV